MPSCWSMMRNNYLLLERRGVESTGVEGLVHVVGQLIIHLTPFLFLP